MRRLSYIQPILTKYREPFFKELSVLFDLRVYAEKPSSDFGDFSGCGYISLKWKKFNIFYYCKYSILKKCLSNSDDIIHFADFKYLSLWYFLIVCTVKNKNLWLHGQGGYKKEGVLSNIIYICMLFFSKGYICYNKFSADSLRKKVPRFLHKKISFMNNTLYMKPVDKVEEKYSSDLFYIGRIREGCGIEFLLKAAKEVNVNIKIVGGGERDYVDKLQVMYDNGAFFGAIFDREEQLAIAKKCMAGVYGGDAGLSVVHYMAFGLPVIVHDLIEKHMGPEPSYIKDGENGVTFERGNLASLSKAILKVKEDKKLRSDTARGALNTYIELSKLPMHEKLYEIISSR